jgi:hypothetical protein
MSGLSSSLTRRLITSNGIAVLPTCQYVAESGEARSAALSSASLPG